jgi:hypothetical protein
MELDKTLKPYSCNLFAWQIDALRHLQQKTDIGVQVHVRNALTVFLNQLNKA